jgi:hypothetical protein
MSAWFFVINRCDNLIPGMATACYMGVESGKLVYPSTFGHVPTCVYMSYRPNKSFIPKKHEVIHVQGVLLAE